MLSPRAYARLLLPMVLLFGLAAIVGLAAYQLRAGEGVGGAFSVANHPAEAASLNDPAPTFSLPSLTDGSTISFPPEGARLTVLNFWASWCSPCRIEAPGLQRVWKDYRSEGVRFVGVDERDNDGAGRAFLREFGLGYPSTRDPAGALADDFGLFGMPTTFVVDGSGVLRYRFVGFVEEDGLRRVLDELLGES